MFPGLDFRQQNTTILSLRQPLLRRGRRRDVDELTKLVSLSVYFLSHYCRCLTAGTYFFSIVCISSLL